MRVPVLPRASDQRDRMDKLQDWGEAAPDGVIAARWAGELDLSSQRRWRNLRTELRAQVAQTRADLAQARVQVAQLEHECEAAAAEAERWRRSQAVAALECVAITARRDALIDSLGSGLTVMLTSASLQAWDEGWDAAADGLPRIQNPHRREAQPPGSTRPVS